MATKIQIYSEESEFDDFIPVVIRPIESPFREEDMNQKRFDGTETPDWFFSEASETDHETPEVSIMNINWDIELEVCKITDDTLSEVEYQLSTAEVSEDNVPEEVIQEELTEVTPAGYIADKLLSDEGA